MVSGALADPRQSYNETPQLLAISGMVSGPRDASSRTL